MADTQPIVDGCSAFWQAWCERDSAGLVGAWDMDDEAGSYLPADEPHKLVGAAAVRGYMTMQLQRFALIRMRPQQVCPRRLKDDLGTVFAVLDWARQSGEGLAPVGGTLRISAVLRRRADHWRVCHYAEAPLAPLVELRSFYQQIAADGHEAIL